MWQVVKSIHRRYGYSLHWVGVNCPSWALSTYIGWYKFKCDAEARAKVLNLTDAI